MPVWYSQACQNNAIYLGVFIAIIVLCWLFNGLMTLPFGKNLVPDPAVRQSAKKFCFETGVTLFLIGMLVLFACANSNGAGGLL